MISESKFLKDLKDLGLVQQRTTLELQVKIQKQENLPKGAEECREGQEKGTMAKGTQTIEAIKVLGFWQWIPELDWGVIAEIDVAEGYGPVKVLHTIENNFDYNLVTFAVISSAFILWEKNIAISIIVSYGDKQKAFLKEITANV